MSSNSKRLTIRLDVDDHEELKIMAAKKGDTLRQTVETLIENYVYGSADLPKEIFINNQKNIKLVKEVYMKIKTRLEEEVKEEVKEEDNKKKRDWTLTNVAKGLICKGIIKGYSNNFIKRLETGMSNYYSDSYGRNNPSRNKVISFNINAHFKNQISDSLRHKAFFNFQKIMEVLFYGYAFDKIDLEDKYFEKVSSSIRIDKELYSAFKDKREYHGKNRTIQKVGETLIKQELESL